MTRLSEAGIGCFKATNELVGTGTGEDAEGKPLACVRRRIEQTCLGGNRLAVLLGTALFDLDVATPDQHVVGGCCGGGIFVFRQTERGTARDVPG